GPTGTGKTYVYLRSIFELNKQYGLTKFIIVVPSDAIRVGTLKTLEITQEHFKSEFNNVSYDYYQYDSSKINKVRDFATTNAIQIMVMTIAAFNRQSNNIYNVKDTFGEYLPIDLIKATNPVVIIDEPQSVDNTENAKDAIKELSPLFILRYSATHRELYNQIYKLNVVDALSQKLVKQIEVASIEDAVFADVSSKPYLKVIEITPKLELSLELEVQDKTGKISIKTVKKIPKGTNLADKTNNQVYDGYVVEDFSRDYGLKLANLDYELAVGQAIGNEENIELKTSVMIRLVIENHIKRELRLLPQNIKVLSLFFINRVVDYRIHNQNTYTDGKLVKMFIEQFKIVLQSSDGKKYIKKAYELFGIDLTNDDGLNQLHDGYFAKDKKGGYKDCKSDTQDAEVAYDLIMKDKEKLLDIKRPLRFIFSHSALKEGWDNPNVFQVCVLQNAPGEFKRMQQIGRGMRLCVNSEGIRVKDEKINTLTIIAGESYSNFATSLQKEYETDAKIKFGNIPIKNQKNKVAIKVNQKVFLSPEFKQLWNKINQKTIYQVNIDTAELIANVVKELDSKLEINAPSFKTSRVKLNIDESGIGAELQHTDLIKLNISNELDVVQKIYLATGLTRKTTVTILSRISQEKLNLLNINSGGFIQQVTEIINNKKVELLVSGIKYRKIEEYYAQSLIEQELDYGYSD
ncbi:MAG: DEAD/DEAH box helicase family protein, partial [Burkholderiales bacterium]|nr:DEAD/DEAH box helicase family protein [Burkholderiales bacterium]